MRNGFASSILTLLCVGLLALTSGCKSTKNESAQWDQEKNAKPTATQVAVNEPVAPAETLQAAQAPTYPTIQNSSLANDPHARRYSKTIVYTAMDDATVEGIYAGTSAGSISNMGLPRPVPVVPVSNYVAPKPVAMSTTFSGSSDPSWSANGNVAWRYIVIHHSASDVGSAAIFHRAHIARGWDGLGYHFVIGNGTASGDGEVEVGYRWRDQARGAHAGNNEYNEHGIGICLVGNLENNAATARQMASLRNLVSYLMARYNISTANIIGHRNVPGKSTDCPGRNFNLEAFKNSVANGNVNAGSFAANEPAPAPAARVVPASIPVRTTSSKKSTGQRIMP